MALALAFAALALVPGTIARWLALGAAVGGSFVGAAWGLRAGWHAPLATAWLAGAVAAIARSAFDGWHFLRERNRLAQLFEGYVSPQVFRGVVTGDLAGRGRGTLAILFADVRGFTTLTEHSAADDVLDVLNRYYSAVTPILHAHGATIDAFRGDGLNALFGAPEPQAEAAEAALRAARAMLAALVPVNESLVSAGRAPLQIGIGLACGQAVFGDVGSRDRRDFTAIGDPVNLAARLQDLTRQLDCPILLTDGMHGMLAPGDALGLVDLGVQPIKGHSAVRVWGCNRLRADGRDAAATPRDM
jgi:adenylate cyclase